MDRDLMQLRDSLIPRYATLVYNGYWFSRERTALQALAEESQRFVNGTVELDLCRGNVTVRGRRSDDSLYDERVASMDDDEGAYDPRHATGFIWLHGLPLRAHARRAKDEGKSAGKKTGKKAATKTARKAGKKAEKKAGKKTERKRGGRR
jgi:argininosuccinate synthase